MTQFRAAIALLFVAGISGCDLDCGNEVVATIPSSSGKAKAVVFNRNCGATTGFNTQVGVLAADAEPSGAGNTLILDGTVPLRIHWLSESTLSITGIGAARVFKQEHEVTVGYLASALAGRSRHGRGALRRFPVRERQGAPNLGSEWHRHHAVHGAHGRTRPVEPGGRKRRGFVLQHGDAG
jgi:hypothetical protein